MRFKMKRLSLATMRVLGAGIAGTLLAQPLLAQQPPREKIEVTGSNIKRVEGEGPSAIVIMTREEIDRSGATNAFELMNLVASNNSAGNVSFASTIGALTFSANTASLRGLQGGRTLVLLNGKRLNSFSGEIQGVSGVNLTTIPFNAIERVEVLLDGASAIYGSDAVAGVINFIVRKDYRGAEATVYYGAPTRGGGGGEQTTYKAALGFGDLSKDRYNVFVAAQFDKQEALEQRVRNFSNTSVRLDTGLIGISGTTFPAFVTTGGIGTELRAVALFPRPRRALLLRSGRAGRRDVDSRPRDEEHLRRGQLPVRRQPAGLPQRQLHDVEEQLRHPAGADRRHLRRHHHAAGR
jgi:iron complex outermembrane recepter protein